MGLTLRIFNFYCYNLTPITEKCQLPKTFYTQHYWKSIKRDV